MKNIERAYNVLTSEDNLLNKLLIGGGMIFTFFLIVPVLILSGYLVKILKITEDSNVDSYPDWDNVGSLLIDGVVLTVMNFLILIPIYSILAIPFVTGTEITSTYNTVGRLLFYPISYVTLILFTLYFREGVKSMFDVSRVLNIATSNKYIITYLMVLVIGTIIWIIFSFGVILTLGFGLLFIPFLYFGFQIIVVYSLGITISEVDPKNNVNEEESITDSEIESEFVA